MHPLEKIAMLIKTYRKDKLKKLNNLNQTIVAYRSRHNKKRIGTE